MAEWVLFPNLCLNLQEQQCSNIMIIALGLEAAEPSLIKKYCAEGHLPTFKKLLEDGSFSEALSPSSISSGSTWASVNTGVNPAKHGIGFYHRQLKSGTYDIVKKYADDIKADPFWKGLVGKGKKMAILDAPEIYPIPDFDGIIIAGWGGEALNFKRSSWPPTLLDDVIQSFGDHPLTGWYQRVPNDVTSWKELLGKLETGMKQRIQMYSSLLMEQEWDLFYATVAETHWVGHFFWHWIEEKHPKHQAEMAKEFEDSILKIYQLSDDLLAKLMELRPDAEVIIFSNTGMGPNFSGRHLVPQILEQLGLSPKSNSGLLPQKKWGHHSVKKVEDLVGAKNIEFVKKIFPERLWDKWTRKFLTSGNNWKNSKVFEVPADYTSCLRINVIGREPEGKVNDGAEYDALCQLLTDTFLELINPETGEKAVTKVIKIRDLFKGDLVNDLPDLAIVWKGDSPINALFSDKIKKVEGDLGDKRSGAHLPYGFVAIANTELKPFPDREFIIEDIAPTIMNMLGELPYPNMDGKVISRESLPVLIA